MFGALSVGVSQVVGMLSALGMTAMLARWFSPSGYGTYAFVVAVLLWVGRFSEIGFFSATARLLARCDDEAMRRRLIGVSMLVAAGLFVLFDILVAAASPIVERVFHMNATTAFLWTVPVAGGLALELAVKFICEGAGRSGLLAIRNLTARPLALALLVGAHLAGVLTVAFACMAFALGSTVASCAVFARLKPSLVGLREGWTVIRAEMRRANDGAMYLGRILGSSMFNIDRMLVAYFLTSAAVGYYALAFSLVAPITVGVQSLAISGYGRLARSRGIPGHFFSLSLVWVVGSSAAGYFLLRLFVHSFLPAYRSALGILAPAVLTAAILGVIALFNQFLSAHGRGRTLRRISFFFAISNLTLYVTLIPLAGIEGAAYASLATVMVPLAGNLIAYRRYRSLNGTSAEDIGAVCTIYTQRQSTIPTR